MKKILFYLVFLCSLAPIASNAEDFLKLNESFTVARAVKLGRSSAASSQTIAIQNTGTISMLKECDSNCANCNKVTGVCTSCTSNRYLSNNLCLFCPEKATCNGVSFSCRAGYYKNGQSCSRCSANTYSTGGATYCTSCPSGSFSNAGASSCIPIPANCSSYNSSGSCTKCNSGYYLSGGSCYAEKSCSTGCTGCDKTTGTCSDCASGYYLSSGSCYAEKTCIANCSSCDKTTGKCSACVSGYTLGSNNLACIKDVTSCSRGYYLSGNSCKLCSYGTYSYGGTATSCKSCSTLYVGSNKTCTSCSQSGVCTGSNGGSSSSSGSGSTWNCTGNMIGYTCVNGVKTKCLYAGCQSCANDTLKCISCKPGYRYRAGSNCVK